MVYVLLVVAAKLGRRSHKMRELISEATRTVEDSQTAQALHGLLSLKSPSDCPPSATSALLTSVGELSMELFQQSSTGVPDHQQQIQATGIPVVNTDSVKSPAKSPSQPATSSKSVDRHATLRAAILSPSAAGLQPASVGAAGSAVQILVQMQQDDATAAAKVKPVRAKLAASASAGGNISVVPTTSSTDLNTTHVLLDRSAPVKAGATLSSTKATAAASVPLPSVVQVSDSSTGQAVPIQLIATSQGVLAIPQNYKLMSQNAVAAVSTAATALSTAQVTAPAVAAVSSPAKRWSSPSASAGGLLKVAKLQTAVTTQLQRTSNTISSVVQSEPTVVVANTLPHAISQPLQTAIRDSYEKLFWKVYLQSSSFQRLSRPPDDGYNGGNEVSVARLE